jgi:hypothetical protein
LGVIAPRDKVVVVVGVVVVAAVNKKFRQITHLRTRIFADSLVTFRGPLASRTTAWKLLNKLTVLMLCVILKSKCHLLCSTKGHFLTHRC